MKVKQKHEWRADSTEEATSYGAATRYYTACRFCYRVRYFWTENETCPVLTRSPWLRTAVGKR
jgi:hypothetical protein